MRFSGFWRENVYKRGMEMVMVMKRFLAGLLALVCLFGMSFADARAHAEETVFTGTEDTTETGETAESAETETPENPMISATKLTLELGTQSRLRVNGVMGKFKWKSSDPEVVKVTKYGKLLARAVGKATVTATVNGKTLKCKVTVKEAKYVSIIAVGDNLYHDYMIYKKGSASNGMVDYDNIYSGIKDYISTDRKSVV